MKCVHSIHFINKSLILIFLHEYRWSITKLDELSKRGKNPYYNRKFTVFQIKPSQAHVVHCSIWWHKQTKLACTQTIRFSLIFDG